MHDLHMGKNRFFVRCLQASLNRSGRSQGAIQEFREAAPDRAHYRDFASQIKDPLRSELLKLIATGDTPTAIDKYKSATNSDMRTSMLVLHYLKQSTQPPPPPLPPLK